MKICSLIFKEPEQVKKKKTNVNLKMGKNVNTQVKTIHKK